MVRHYLYRIFLATALIGGLSGCGASAEEIREQHLDAPSDLEILYNSILQEYRFREWSIALESQEKLLVVSDFAKVNTEVRRRHITRIVPLRNGLVMNITAEYQRRRRAGTRETWMPAEDQLILESAAVEEKALNDAIQARFFAQQK